MRLVVSSPAHASALNAVLALRRKKKKKKKKHALPKHYSLKTKNKTKDM